MSWSTTRILTAGWLYQTLWPTPAFTTPNSSQRSPRRQRPSSKPSVKGQSLSLQKMNLFSRWCGSPECTLATECGGCLCGNTFPRKSQVHLLRILRWGGGFGTSVTIGPTTHIHSLSLEDVNYVLPTWPMFGRRRIRSAEPDFKLAALPSFLPYFWLVALAFITYHMPRHLLKSVHPPTISRHLP